MEIGMGYSGDCIRPAEISLGGSVSHPTVEDRLIRRKQDLEFQLKQVTEALTALQNNPEILKVMCLISKVSY